jgi:hypothetical protein
MPQSRGPTQQRNMKNLMPIADVKKLEKLEIIYMPGNPRSYRLDLGKGVLNLEGRNQVTKPGETFKVIPVAFRCLQDGLFGQPEKKWCEVYFLNELGNLCVFMFHGFSVQNLSESARDLFYEKCKLTEAVWTVSLEKKQNKEGQSYYMAFFGFEPLKGKELKAHQEKIIDIEATYFHIYRTDTMEAKTLFFENYSTHLEPTRAEIEAEKERQAGLLREFATKDEKEKIAEAA